MTELEPEMQVTQQEQKQQVTELINQLSSDLKELNTLKKEQNAVHTTFVMCIVLL